MSAIVLALVEHDRGVASETAHQAIAFARSIVEGGAAASVQAVLIGAEADALAATLGAHGVAKVWRVQHDELRDYAPEAWGDALAQLLADLSPIAVVAVGSDRGNEVLAHVAAITDLPFAANVVGVTSTGEGTWALTRVRWGGSLLERASLDGRVKLLSAAAHAFAADPVGGGAVATEVFEPTLGAHAGRTRVVDRTATTTGVSLTTAAVVVSGGRGMGSPGAFAMLEELAGLLKGAVGCSRVVTNNGWRPHADQVGQTGKRIAPDLYIACGISGAIQHWVGMMAAKTVLAINTDREASMVAKADYAVIGDLHAVLPAVIAELKARRST